MLCYLSEPLESTESDLGAGNLEQKQMLQEVIGAQKEGRTDMRTYGLMVKVICRGHFAPNCCDRKLSVTNLKRFEFGTNGNFVTSSYVMV